MEIALYGLGLLFATLGVISANPMFPISNRPEIFRGTFGNVFLEL